MEAQTDITGYTIEYGPSREELFDHLRLPHMGIQLLFDLRERNHSENPKQFGLGFSAYARVKSIEPDDGSGNNWIIEAYLREDTESNASQGFLSGLDRTHVRMYYSTRTRNGRVIDGRPFSARYRVDRLGRLYKGSRFIDKVDEILNYVVNPR